MINEIKIEVAQELVNYIERLQYEVDAYKDVITTLMNAHVGDSDGAFVNSAVFTSYSEKFAEAKAEYELAKEQMTQQYIPSCLTEHNTSWALDFATCQLTITVNCECGQAALDEYLKEIQA